MESGSKIVQENLSKSKDANRGKVALTQITTNIIKKAFKNSQKDCSK